MSSNALAEPTPSPPPEEILRRENADLRELVIGLERDKGRLSMLHAATTALTHARSRAEVVDAIVEIVANAVGCEQTAVFELLPGAKALALVRASGVDAESFGDLALGSGLAGEVVATGRPVFPEGGSPDPAAGGLPVCACVPLQAGDVVEGALMLFEMLPQKSGIEPFDLEVLALVGALGGRALAWTRAESFRGCDE